MRRFRDGAGGRGGRRVPWSGGHRVAVPAVVAVVVLGLSGCGDDGGGAEGGQQGLDVAQIQAAFDRDEPGTVTGKTATLTGEVGNVVSPSAFEIVDGAEPMLVVAEDRRMPDQDDQVRVTGTVRKFDLADVRERLGTEMSKPLFREHQGEPYLWAERIKADIGS